MRKTLITVLILLVAALAGLYQMRFSLLTAAFSAVLQKSDIQLVHLAGLEVGWNSLRIEQLDLGVGENKARQSLQNVDLEYSLTEMRLQRLSISRANLSVPASGKLATGMPATESGPRVTELVEQLINAPLQSMSISALEVSGLEIAQVTQPLQLQVSWDGPHFSALVQDRDRQLHVRIQQEETAQILVTSRLDSDKEQIMQLNATVSQQDDQLQIQGEGRFALAALVPLLAAQMELPELAPAATGEVAFQLTAGMDDRAPPVRQQWQIMLLPETVLGLTLKPAESALLVGDFSLTLAQPVFATLKSKGEEEVRLTLSGQSLVWQLDEQRYALDVGGEMSALHCDYVETLQCDAALAVQLQAPAMTLDGEQATTATGVKLQLSSQLTLEDRQLTAILAPGELARAATLQQGDIRVEQPLLVADAITSLSYKLDVSQWELHAQSLQLLLPRAETPHVNLAARLGLSGLEISHGAEHPLRSRVHLSSQGLNLQRPGTWLPALAVEADIALDHGLLSVKGQVQSDQQKPLFALSAEHQLDVQGGSARILADALVFSAEENRLSRYFSHWPFKWDVYQGRVMLAADVSWQRGLGGIELQGKINQRMEGIAGVYKDIGFVGLDVDFEAGLSPSGQLVSTGAATVSLETLDVGVPVKDIQARFQLDVAQQELTLQTMEAKLFGGRVWTKDAVYRVGDAHNRIDIGVDGLQLGQLLALAGYDAVEGSGQISGLLPVDVSAAGVVMQRGMLAARAPGGIFRYRAEVGAGTDAATAQVIKALGNYHYSIFQVEADYLESGELQLQMLLRGHNPDYDKGRPIHLNLDVTDNIPKLLKSLQSGREIANIISQKLDVSP
jgi:hypothetical protein